MRHARMDENLVRAFLEHVPDNVYFKDRQSRFVCISRSMAAHFGLKNPEDAIGKTDFDMFTREHAEQAFADEQQIILTGQPIIEKEEKETWEDGSESWALTTKLPWRDRDGEIIGTMGISRDITERRRVELELERYRTQLEDLVAQRTAELVRANELLKQENVARNMSLQELDSKAKELARANAELENLSFIDDLTGLYNRRGFFTLAEHGVRLALREAKSYSVVFVDMDSMKAINDTWGHDEGNQALRDAAEVLRRAFRSSDVLARIGGDEFAVFVLQADAEEVRSRIRQQLGHYAKEFKRSYKLSLSVGVATGHAGRDADIASLLAHADALMYEQKHKKPLRRAVSKHAK
jgi:diguanylate cyclase (GGDEF)-like protein/PAS domain S-box-containing protein